MNHEQIPASVDLITILRSLLSPHLGKFADGRTALWVEPPQSPKVGNGLHVFINRHYSQMSNRLGQWRVSFVLHGDRATSETLYEINLQKFDAAILAMRSHFPSRREIALPFREDIPPQISFLLSVDHTYTKPMLIYSP